MMAQTFDQQTTSHGDGAEAERMRRASVGFPANVSARFLDVAAQARLTLAGRVVGGGFWKMPAGEPFVRLCWRNNLDLARRSRPVLP